MSWDISKEIGTISLDWRVECHYARAGTIPVKCSELVPRRMALRDCCATSQIQFTLNLLVIRGGCKESLICAGHLVTPRSVHLARDLCTYRFAIMRHTSLSLASVLEIWLHSNLPAKLTWVLSCLDWLVGN